MQRPNRTYRKVRELVSKEVEHIRKANIIEPATSKGDFHVIIVSKHDRSYRMGTITGISTRSPSVIHISFAGEESVSIPRWMQQSSQRRTETGGIRRWRWRRKANTRPPLQTILECIGSTKCPLGLWMPPKRFSVFCTYFLTNIHRNLFWYIWVISLLSWRPLINILKIFETSSPHSTSQKIVKEEEEVPLAHDKIGISCPHHPATQAQYNRCAHERSQRHKVPSFFDKASLFPLDVQRLSTLFAHNFCVLASLYQFLRTGLPPNIPQLDDVQAHANKTLVAVVTVYHILFLLCSALPYLVATDASDPQFDAELFQTQLEEGRKPFRFWPRI